MNRHSLALLQFSVWHRQLGALDFKVVIAQGHLDVGKLPSLLFSLKDMADAEKADGRLCFIGCMLVNTLDIASFYLTAPLLIPYGQWLGASNAQIGTWPMAFNGLAILSALLLPKLADARGPKTCLLISAGGSGLGYLLQGSASFWRGSPGGLQAVLVGHAIAGLFSGTRPVLYAVMKDATKKNQNLFNKRIGISVHFIRAALLWHLWLA